MRPQIVGVRKHLIPDRVDLLEVRADSVMSVVAPGLNPGPGEGAELCVRFVEPQKCVDVAVTDGFEAASDHFDVVIGHAATVAE